MEVHHHPTIEKKNFKEYFLEFLMIFLAVTMGFFAENIREHLSDKNKEIKYVESFVRDLKADTADINHVLIKNKKKDKAFDSLLLLSSENLNNLQLSKTFIAYLYKVTFDVLHHPANTAITQIKNTGSMALFNHNGIIDSMLEYDEYNTTLIEYNNLYLKDFDALWEAIYPVVDIKLFVDTSYGNIQTRQLTQKQTPPLNLNKEIMALLTGHLTRQLLLNSVTINLASKQYNRAISLIAFLSKEYHLQNN
jgi:hypothetical protein